MNACAAAGMSRTSLPTKRTPRVAVSFAPAARSSASARHGAARDPPHVENDHLAAKAGQIQHLPIEGVAFDRRKRNRLAVSIEGHPTPASVPLVELCDLRGLTCHTATHMTGAMIRSTKQGPCPSPRHADSPALIYYRR